MPYNTGVSGYRLNCGGSYCNRGNNRHHPCRNTSDSCAGSSFTLLRLTKYDHYNQQYQQQRQSQPSETNPLAMTLLPQFAQNEPAPAAELAATTQDASGFDASSLVVDSFAKLVKK